MDEKLEVPQATLERTREVVDAIAGGACSREQIERATGIARRQVGYGVASARSLGLALEASRDSLALTERGRALAGTVAGSEDEAAELREAIGSSPTVNRLAPGLFAPEPPPREQLIERIKQLAELADNTAAHRAGMILRWRKQLLDAPDPLSRKARQIGGRWRRLSLRNFRSFAELVIDLPPLVVLAGPNSSGKSNLLDALWLACELGQDGQRAVARRGGLARLLHRGCGDELFLEVRSAATRQALDESYLLHRMQLAPQQDSGWHFLSERIELCYQQQVLAWIDRAPQQLTTSTGQTLDDVAPTCSAIRHAEPLRLPSRLIPLRHVMRYDLDPRSMRVGCEASEESRLLGAGANLAAAIARARTSRSFPGLVEALRNVVAGLVDIDTVDVDGRVSLAIELASGQGETMRLDSWALSDGGLRALGLMVAILQLGSDELLLVEHPETNLCADAQAVVFDALQAASRRAGVVLTTHSESLAGRVDKSSLFSCRYRAGRTAITEHE